jgi:hypothetical protein
MLEIKKPTVSFPLKELSEWIVPLMLRPFAFPLVEKLASWNFEQEPQNDLSDIFLKNCLQHRKKLYDKFSPRTKSIMWSRHIGIFLSEIMNWISTNLNNPLQTTQERKESAMKFVEAFLEFPFLFIEAIGFVKQLFLELVDSRMAQMAFILTSVLAEAINNSNDDGPLAFHNVSFILFSKT